MNVNYAFRVKCPWNFFKKSTPPGTKFWEAGSRPDDLSRSKVPIIIQLLSPRCGLCSQFPVMIPHSQSIPATPCFCIKLPMVYTQVPDSVANSQCIPSPVCVSNSQCISPVPVSVPNYKCITLSPCFWTKLPVHISQSLALY